MYACQACMLWRTVCMCVTLGCRGSAYCTCLCILHPFKPMGMHMQRCLLLHVYESSTVLHVRTVDLATATLL